MGFSGKGLDWRGEHWMVMGRGRIENGRNIS